MATSRKKTPALESAAFARERVLVSFFGGVLVVALVGFSGSWIYAPLVGWDTACIIFLFWIYISLRGRTPEETERLARREDPTHTMADLLLIFASIASLGAVGGLLIEAGKADDGTKTILIALGAISVLLSWFMIHTVYMLKYARIYYKENGGIDFYSATPPRYSDFAYAAFTIGMTFQISDNNFKTNEFRRVALRHALLSFLFGTIILASVINFIAGLAK
jgi:uncharacterized membrane protein